MAKTCIVCGQAAGSGEHVFPAALGGRRVNSGIYCPKHDNSYSGLVGEIAGQLDFLNAYLGVRPDHANQPKTAYGEHTLTGETVSISAKEIRFTEPRVISRTPIGEGEKLHLGFPNQQSVKQFTKKMEDEGYEWIPLSKPSTRPYITGSIHHKRKFGGACGLGAIAYMTQTFFAQEFPEVARSGALSDFINYTQAIAKVAALGGCEQQPEEREELTEARSALMAALKPFGDTAPAWWDFSPSASTRANKFEFGHRVTVGIDGSDGQIYGRVVLFSALTFAMRLGTAPQGSATREVTVDIDPLAEHPPLDIDKHQVLSAPGRVQVPEHATEGLANALANGTQQRAFGDLLARLEEHQLLKLAHTMSKTFAPCAALSPLEARALIEKELDSQPQQIWRMVTCVVDGLKEKMAKGNLATITPMLDGLIAHDVQSVSGLSQQAEVTLALAKAALVAQIEEDCAAGLLNEVRVAELMGRGPGLHVVGQAVLAPVLQVFGEPPHSNEVKG
ncbi:hypothetical protein [Pseudomonas aeruginosa]|uniref:hypothetical protein n=1 Tax=Pseudomonas aeruginosa TaxID=287 RepID=UPI00070CABC9|nr:hypothetical protein [Pseudomonas aeruginosa]